MPLKLKNPKEQNAFYFADVKDISGLAMARRELDEKVTQLSAALAKVKQLEGILPICMYCKKIRDDDQCWHQLEQYISKLRKPCLATEFATNVLIWHEKP